MPPEPQRPDLTPDMRAHLSRARSLGRSTERHRQAMLADAAAGHGEILWLLENGYSQRALAEDLSVAPVVVQAAWEKARKREPGF